MSTIHATTPRDALVRLETLSLMSDVEIPVHVARAQVASAIDLIVQVARFAADGSRKITRIAEAVGLDDKQQYQLRDLFVLRPGGMGADGRLIADLTPTGQQPSFSQEPWEQGLSEMIHHTEGAWAKM
jgi:pilus assembly protein CpaF